MTVVYASDDRFAQILGVSLVSLFENNRNTELFVCVLDDKIAEQNKKKLLSIGETYRRSLKFIPIPDLDELAGQKINAQRWSLTTFARLYLPSLLPDLKRVIYIDCDTLVMGDLSALDELSLSPSHSCAGVVECMGDRHKINVELEPEDDYINAGVMLIDLDRWRQQQTEQSFSRYIQKKRGMIPYVDQGVINYVLKNQIYILPPEYNMTTVCYDFQYEELPRYRRTKYPYSKESFEQAKKNPVIVHFTTSFLSRRPWIDAKQTHRFAIKWREYKAMSPWADEPLWADNRGFVKKTYEAFCKRIPRPIAVEISGFLHSTMKALNDRRLLKNALK